MQRLVSSNTELERFAYVASHDMQEPLRMISGISDIVVTDYADKLDDEGKNYLSIIRDSSERMRNMVKDLLDYARVEKASGSTGRVNLNSEFNSALENLAELIRERKAEVTADALPSFSGNPVQMMRLLQNLIANALKYQPPNQTPVIHIGAEHYGDFWHISIKDNGLGIAPEFVDKIFEPFRRLHGWDEIKGIGLGLSICKKIVENHSGKLWVTSEPGKGSVFHFTIPKSTE